MMKGIVAAICVAALLPIAGFGQKKGGKKKAEPPPEVRVAEKIEKTRIRLALAPAGDETARTLGRIGERLLEDARNRLRAGQTLEANHLARSAESLGKSIEHIRRSQDPLRIRFHTREEQTGRMEKAYFRLQQADYFTAQTPEPAAKELAVAARQLYQRARQAFDAGNGREVEELTKAAEEAVKGIEHLARMSLPTREPPRVK